MPEGAPDRIPVFLGTIRKLLEKFNMSLLNLINRVIPEETPEEISKRTSQEISGV